MRAARSGTPRAGSKNLTLQFLSAPAPMPDITMKTIDGKTISSSTWRGKVTIVNFWATWCPPCRAEIPDLIALQEKYRDQVQIIGISEDEDPPEAVRAFAEQHHINYPIVMKTEAIGKVFSGIYALPTSYMVDRDLKIAVKHVGMLNADATEEESRVLAGMASEAKVEYVEDSNKQLIKNAAQAKEIPGIDLAKLTPAQRTEALRRMNSETCTCGCTLTVAACRINDPSCSISLPIARKIADEAATARP